VHLHEHDSLLRAARADRTAGPELRQDYMATGPTSSAPSPRSPPGGGRRLKLRYHGLTRNNAWLKRRTAAVNLRNLPAAAWAAATAPRS
jgi:hypothetical protein